MMGQATLHKTQTRQQWMKELQRTVECGKNRQIFYLTGSFLLYKGSGLPSYALKRRVLNVDAPSHPAVSIPSSLPAFPSYKTLNSASQPLLRNFTPLLKKRRFCSFLSCAPSLSLSHSLFPYIPSLHIDGSQLQLSTWGILFWWSMLGLLGAGRERSSCWELTALG